MSSGESGSSRKKSLNCSTSLANCTRLRSARPARECRAAARSLRRAVCGTPRAASTCGECKAPARRPGASCSGLIAACRPAAPAVAGHAGHANLHTHMAEPARHVRLRAVDDLRDFAARSVAVAIGGFAALASEQLVDRNARLASLDIPQRLVDAADARCSARGRSASRNCCSRPATCHRCGRRACRPETASDSARRRAPPDRRAA